MLQYHLVKVIARVPLVENLLGGGIPLPRPSPAMPLGSCSPGPATVVSWISVPSRVAWREKEVLWEAADIPAMTVTSQELTLVKPRPTLLSRPVSVPILGPNSVPHRATHEPPRCVPLCKNPKRRSSSQEFPSSNMKSFRKCSFMQAFRSLACGKAGFTNHV